MDMRGATGEVRWSYLTAATYGPWHLDTDTATLTGSLVSVDAYRVAQAPLTATVMMGRARLSWPIEDLQIRGEQVTIRLGPRQRD